MQTEYCRTVLDRLIISTIPVPLITLDTSIQQFYVCSLSASNDNNQYIPYITNPAGIRTCLLRNSSTALSILHQTEASGHKPGVCIGCIDAHVRAFVIYILFTVYICMDICKYVDMYVWICVCVCVCVLYNGQYCMGAGAGV